MAIHPRPSARSPSARQPRPSSAQHRWAQTATLTALSAKVPKPTDPLLYDGFAAKDRGTAMESPRERILTLFRETGTTYTIQLAQAMAAAGVELGLEPQAAVLVAKETVAGAGLLLMEDGANPAVLRREIGSPGTMTERAISAFDELGLQSLIVEGLRSAATYRQGTPGC